MRLIDADEFLHNEIKRCGCVPIIGSCYSDEASFKDRLNDMPTIEPDDIKPKCEWINVKDRLPKEDVRVLVYLGNYDGYPVIDTDRIIRNGWVRWNRYVTHWMQLPDKPYMRGEE